MRRLTFAVLAALCVHAWAAEFPSKPVRLVVPNPAGGTVDIVARLLAHAMAPMLEQNVIVEIKPGADTIIGSELVARAQADGHTLLMIGTPFVANPHLHKLPYDTRRDFAPVARFVSLPYVIAVHPSVPAKSLQELVGYAKSHPSALHYASFAYGQLVAESLKAVAGIDMNYIPYQGGVQATIAVVGGHAGVLVGPLSDATPHIASGKLRPLAVTVLQRPHALKEVPTVAESGYPGFEWPAWIGAVAPSGTPAPVLAKLSTVMLRGLDSAEAEATFARLNLVTAPMEPGEFGQFLRAQTSRLETIIQQAHLKVE